MVPMSVSLAPVFVRATLLKPEAGQQFWVNAAGEPADRSEESTLSREAGLGLRDADAPAWRKRYWLADNVLILFFEKLPPDELLATASRWVAHFVDPVTQEVRTWPRDLVLVNDFAGDKK